MACSMTGSVAATAAAAAAVGLAVGYLVGNNKAGLGAGCCPVKVQPKGVFVLIIRLEFKEGARAGFIKRWAELAKFVQANEPNTLTYELTTTNANPNEAFIYERYVSESDLKQTHCGSKAFKDFEAWLNSADIVTGRDVWESTESNVGFAIRQ
ncbi:uncharacterized protein MONBRDRAFT_30243 [Monosiga brevicollis MX1]|uniref:ABM domain-containing protein n=1 Tax=Monosiga brevicollis TaxID=81824 RepID=A9VDE5_MONBE|nr:uncharacterized protein MONBRDRAFT_30243 [Monosiga brevicollis MX1]EDQ84457.1 predicted protein [Monosiga brevicollis MX1]|eukprot:XP_001750752.1 hypothetical protein [Monosiga brevicollis MX1]